MEFWVDLCVQNVFLRFFDGDRYSFFAKTVKFRQIFIDSSYFSGNIDKIGGMGKLRPCDLRDSCSLRMKKLERGAV